MMPDFLALPGQPCECYVDDKDRYVPCEEHAVALTLVLWG